MRMWLETCYHAGSGPAMEACYHSSLSRAGMGDCQSLIGGPAGPPPCNLVHPARWQVHHWSVILHQLNFCVPPLG